MRQAPSRLCATAFAVCLALSSQAQAEFISWNFSWAPTAPAVLADNPAQGQITLSQEAGWPVVGDAYIRATNLNTVSTADPSSLVTFTNRPYGLTLTLTDDASGKSGVLNFSGVLNATLYKNALWGLGNTVSAPQVQSIQLGNHLYQAQLLSYPPSPFIPNTLGNDILARVTVSDVPEPSTLALAGLCLALCGAGWGWRRLRGRAAAWA